MTFQLDRFPATMSLRLRRDWSSSRYREDWTSVGWQHRPREGWGPLNNIIGTFGISHDITEKKLAAEMAAMRLLGKYAPADLVRRIYREKSEPVLGGELMEISIG
jgi:hypothetical protein